MCTRVDGPIFVVVGIVWVCSLAGCKDSTTNNYYSNEADDIFS